MYCGIDIFSETIDICIEKPDGSFLSATLLNSSIGFRKLMQLTKGFTYHFVMESTGVYHLSLCVYLEKKSMPLQRSKSVAS